MMTSIRMWVIVLIIGSCFSLQAQTYVAAESVEYDPINDQWLVSNGTNMLSVSNDGDIDIFGSSSSSHGMEVLGGNVFASNGNGIVGVDLTTFDQVMNLPIPESLFINGMTTDGESTLYATDFSANRIYKIDVTDVTKPDYEVLVDNTFQTPNGIVYDKVQNRLLYTTWSNNARIKAVDLNTLQQTVVVNTNLGFIDGIDDDENGNYYISSWDPAEITRFNGSFTEMTTVTTPPLSNPADIGYSQSKKVLGIPMGSEVIFLDFNALASLDLGVVNRFEVIGNPIQDGSTLVLELTSQVDGQVELLGANGELLSVLHSGSLEGVMSFDISEAQIPHGQYIISLEVGKSRKSIQFTKL